MLPLPRTARYSGSARPAWRMNHTGVWAAGWRRQARRNGWSATTDTRPDSTGRAPETVRRASSAGTVGNAAIFECFPLMASHPDLEAEQAHIDHAYRRLDAMRATADGIIGEGANLGLAGPGALLAALERSRTGHMRDIVATVQREQDEIIRAPLAGVLVVQGGPGTGKTAVALHRAAYLLYTHRFPLERQGVLVVGPNPLFLRYIEHVLPSLGESGADMTTVSGLVLDATVSGVDRPEAARLKGDPRMVRFIRRAIQDRQRPLRHDLTVGFGPHTLRMTAAESADLVASVRRRDRKSVV